MDDFQVTGGHSRVTKGQKSDAFQVGHVTYTWEGNFTGKLMGTYSDEFIRGHKEVTKGQVHQDQTGPHGPVSQDQTGPTGQ